MPPTATPPPDYATKSTLLKNKINQLKTTTATAVEKIMHAITSLHTIQDTPATNGMDIDDEHPTAPHISNPAPPDLPAIIKEIKNDIATIT